MVTQAVLALHKLCPKGHPCFPPIMQTFLKQLSLKHLWNPTSLHSAISNLCQIHALLPVTSRNSSYVLSNKSSHPLQLSSSGEDPITYLHPWHNWEVPWPADMSQLNVELIQPNKKEDELVLLVGRIEKFRCGAPILCFAMCKATRRKTDFLIDFRNRIHVI